MCLWCNKTFRTTEDVQRHMRSKGHCKMNIEGDALLEYDEWSVKTIDNIDIPRVSKYVHLYNFIPLRYDYSSSYPDAENPEEEVDLNNLDDSGFELVLPSGAKVGHRSLVR